MMKEMLYATGLFEGEGNIGVVRFGPEGRYIALRLKIRMVDREPLEIFQRVVGCGRIYGPWKRPEGRQPIYEWRSTNPPDIIRLYEEWKPWLSPRRIRQFDAAIIERASRTSRHRS